LQGCIVQEGYRDPGLGLSVGRRLLERHAGEKIVFNDKRGGKEAANQRIRIRRLPGRDEIGVEGQCLRVVPSVQMQRAIEHACRMRDRLRDVELRSDGSDVDRNVEHERRLTREKWLGRHRRKQTHNTKSNRNPASSHCWNPIWNYRWPSMPEPPPR